MEELEKQRGPGAGMQTRTSAPPTSSFTLLMMYFETLGIPLPASISLSSQGYNLQYFCVVCHGLELRVLQPYYIWKKNEMLVGWLYLFSKNLIKSYNSDASEWKCPGFCTSSVRWHHSWRNVCVIKYCEMTLLPNEIVTNRAFVVLNPRVLYIVMTIIVCIVVISYTSSSFKK